MEWHVVAWLWSSALRWKDKSISIWRYNWGWSDVYFVVYSSPQFSHLKRGLRMSLGVKGRVSHRVNEILEVLTYLEMSSQVWPSREWCVALRAMVGAVSCITADVVDWTNKSGFRHERLLRRIEKLIQASSTFVFEYLLPCRGLGSHGRLSAWVYLPIFGVIPNLRTFSGLDITATLSSIPTFWTCELPTPSLFRHPYFLRWGWE